ncbi:SGNH/GDSL hydrolase family protein [Singulisphaera sp. PoT]|uniref:SGNH/GDSL hydrolase family protein n=1 Tax=Singulisphaera sp. PoT TaxID=3411797 RepID=UPI003BF595DC
MLHRSALTPQLLLTLALLAWGLVPGGLALGRPMRLRDALASDLMSKADYERMERGYYEQILDSGRQLGSPAGEAPAGSNKGGWAHLDTPPFEAGPLALVVDDIREFVLKPSLSIIHDGASWSTNAEGMRDRDYPKAKPPQTYRMAFVGDSIGAGWGVDDGKGFEPTLEQMLDERSRQAGGPAVEILNFAVPGHGPGQRWEHFSRNGWAYQPDFLIYEATLADAGWDERRLRGLLPRGVGWDVPFYREVLALSKAQPGGTMDSYKKVLKPFRMEFLAGVYRAIASGCRSRGVPVVWILVPRVGKPAEPEERRKLIDLARESGFAATIDLSDAYDGLDPQDLAIGPKDYHPNAEGHALLAHRLDEALRRLPQWRQPGPTGTGGGQRP